MSESSPESRLAEFLAKFTPEVEAFAVACLELMRAELPGTIQLVYDNYNALAIGFGPTERASDAVFSIAVFPRWVSLFFLQGKNLPDPDGLLKGSGNQVRHIVLRTPGEITSRGVRSLMKVARQEAGLRVKKGAPCTMVIKSVSAKQRPRRPALKKSKS